MKKAEAKARAVHRALVKMQDWMGTSPFSLVQDAGNEEAIDEIGDALDNLYATVNRLVEAVRLDNADASEAP